MRILEARQALADCVAAQDFGGAAQLKDAITELENQRNLVLQEEAPCSKPPDREVRTEKARLHARTPAHAHTHTHTHTGWPPTC